MSTHDVRIRPLEDGETGPVLDVFAGLRPRSRELRFMTPKYTLTSTDLRHLTQIDGHDRVALVAETPDGCAVGVARFVRDPGDADSADMAIAVVDGWQSRGIGTQLAEALSECARDLAVRRFTVLMHPDNTGAFRLMERSNGDIRPLALDDQSAEYEITLAS
jgi:RimJ/RimL family protein N-acetyltransferase